MTTSLSGPRLTSAALAGPAGASQVSVTGMALDSSTTGVAVGYYVGAVTTVQGLKDGRPFGDPNLATSMRVIRSDNPS